MLYTAYLILHTVYYIMHTIYTMDTILYTIYYIYNIYYILCNTKYILYTSQCYPRTSPPVPLEHHGTAHNHGVVAISNHGILEGHRRWVRFVRRDGERVVEPRQVDRSLVILVQLLIHVLLANSDVLRAKYQDSRRQIRCRLRAPVQDQSGLQGFRHKQQQLMPNRLGIFKLHEHL